jgi:aminotransferase in exopolysaccharide biosynthesis
MTDPLVRFIRDQYRSDGAIPLHAPVFAGNERRYVADTLESTFVSSVGAWVDRFEASVAAYAASPSATAVVNGTAALHLALRLVGVVPGDCVITQALTFVATCTAISHCGAEPVFVDIDRHTLGLSPEALERWLHEHARVDGDGVCRTRADARVVRACVPMHTFGHPAEIEALAAVCERWSLALVEDAAEALGSLRAGRHAGTSGRCGTLSFNGNKIVTTGGGGMILADAELGRRARHLSTTAKTPHPFEFRHDEIGWNYRMPNLNAALGVAQFERIEAFVACKRELARRYAAQLAGGDLEFVVEPSGCRSNYWLNAVVCPDPARRDALLQTMHAAGVMARPVWTPMTRLSMYAACRHGPLPITEWLAPRLVNLPSGVPAGWLEAAAEPASAPACAVPA